ncbi:MAG TPA: acyl-CoA dehydrogenase family protein [SAR202 cluster bacterium]|nr:acyl-CoA dehydrogenase family protein [SAR202 cluster bacterium]HJO81687.1 acyl-CoA dehydrogenase family protein [SAR202 cluster bacterium]|tara:strand:+ start:4783 stop:5919 length:1137 start_codon:yes stop_codon:yes gene_type:complete
MDLALTEAQEMLRSSARDFLERECPTSLVRAMEQDDRGYPPQLWEQIAGLGWMGVPFPAEYDGADGSLTDLAVLLEETGRAMTPGPLFTSVVDVGLTILDAGTDTQRKVYIPRLASGALIGSAAILENDARYSAQAITLPAKRIGNGYQISGAKLFVEYANSADLLLVPVRTNASSTDEDGVTVLLVETSATGVALEPMASIARDRQFAVTFDNVTVSDDAVLGEAGAGWPIVRRMLDRSTIFHCAQSVGGAQRVMEMTVDYAKQRVQFGRAIGSFQSVQHDCADMVNAIDAARLATYQAITRLEDGAPADKEIAMAKVLANHAYKWTTLTAQQIHGGVGFMEEYDLQLWTRRAKVAELKFGTSAPHRDTFATAMGLR